MDGMEMGNFREAARVVEKMADFAGSVIMQLLQKQGYVEEKGVKALLTHVRGGGTTLTAAVSEERAEDFKELLKEAHIPFVEIARTDPETGERTIFFVYRDNDRDRMGEVLKKFALQIDKSCHEVDLETFGNIVAEKKYSMVTGLTKGEVYAFRESAWDHDIHFCVVADGSRYGIVADSRSGLSGALEDMCRNLSGSEGREYTAAVEQYLEQQESLVERMKPEPGKVKYLVNAKNPCVFLSVDERGITAHSVGILPPEAEPGQKPENTEKDCVYDCRHISYPYSRERIKQLAVGLHNPVILTQEEFSGMVEGIAENGEAVLSQDFIHGFKTFVERMEKREVELSRLPVREDFCRDKEPVPEEIKKIEREAAERMKKMEIREQVMSRERADRMRDQAIDRKMTQEPDR